MLPEFDHEMSSTRKALERVPNDKLQWKPHDKSMDLGGLMSHLSNLPHWATLTINQDSFDVSPDGKPYRQEAKTSVEAALEHFDKNVAAARAALAEASDEHLLKPWSLLATGNTIFTQPRIGVLRGMVLNHMIHHRGQLTVYLRLNDIPVPALYGPSADEQV